MFHGWTWKRAAEVSLGLLLSAAAAAPTGYGGEPATAKRTYAKGKVTSKSQPAPKREFAETYVQPQMPIQVVERQETPMRRGILQSLFGNDEAFNTPAIASDSYSTPPMTETNEFGRQWRTLRIPRKEGGIVESPIQLVQAQADDVSPSAETPITEGPVEPAGPAPIVPQDPGPMPDVGEMSPAQSALRLGAPLSGAIGSAGTIETDNLPSLPQTTGDLLETSPEVSTRRTSALNQDARIRAYHSGQVVATANGINQYKTRIDIDSLFSAIDPGLIQSIDVVNGPYTPLYGPGFGFLSARLFQSPRSASGLDGGGNVIYDQATNGGGIYTRETAWGAGEYWGAYFSYGMRAASDYSPGGNSLDFRVPASYQTWNAYLAAGVDLTSRSRLEVNYLRNEVNGLEIPGVIYDINNAHTDQMNARYIVQEDKEGPENFVVQYWYTRDDYYGDSQRFSKHLTFYDRFITANFLGRFGTGDPTVTLSNLANTYAQGDQMSHGFRTYGTIGEVDSMQLTVGTDWRRYDKFYSEQHLDFADTPATVPFGIEPFGIPSSSQEDYGFFANLMIPFSDDITVNIGGRIDQSKSYVEIPGTSDVVPPPVNLDPNEGVDDPTTRLPFSGYNQSTELLGMAYIQSELRLTESLYLMPGIGYGTRMPTLDELYSDAVFVPLVRSGNSIAVGNSFLTSEKGLQLDLGLRHQGESFNGSIRGFYSYIEDYILYNFLGTAGATVDPTSNFASHVYQYTNLDHATLYGGDMYGEWSPPESSVALYATMAYLRGINGDATYTSDVAGAGLQPAGSDALPGIYPLNSILGVRFFDPDTQWWSLALQLRMVKGQDVVAATLFEQPTAGFTTMDIIGSVQATKNMRVFTSLENVFDRTYTEHGSLLVVNSNGDASFVKEPGINFRIGVELSF